MLPLRYSYGPRAAKVQQRPAYTGTRRSAVCCRASAKGPEVIHARFILDADLRNDLPFRDSVSHAQRLQAKVVIIGSGPSAHTAAIYAGRAELEPLVFEVQGAPREFLLETANSHGLPFYSFRASWPMGLQQGGS